MAILAHVAPRPVGNLAGPSGPLSLLPRLGVNVCGWRSEAMTGTTEKAILAGAVFGACRI